MRAEPILSASDLRLRYRNGALGVVDVSFQVAPGEIVAMFGANGAGKTSSVRAASGFSKADARLVHGRVVLDGHDVTNGEPHRQARMGLFFVPERDKVFPNLTVADNLRAIGRAPKGDRRTELYDRLYSLFPILAERQGQQAGRLSGGQRQMLALGRGILSNPKVLIIDEMTLGLHHSLQEPLFAAVQAVAASGTAVVLVDESTTFALKVADHCYLLGSGELRAEGPPEVFRDAGLVAAGYVDAS